MINIILPSQLIETIKVFVIIFGLLHFLYGMNILFQISKTRGRISLPGKSNINIFSSIYTIMLLLVVFLAVFF